MTLHFIREKPDMGAFTSTTAVELFEKVEAAMAAAEGGRYRAFNLIRELKNVGLEIRLIEPPPERHAEVARLAAD